MNGDMPTFAASSYSSNTGTINEMWGDPPLTLNVMRDAQPRRAQHQLIGMEANMAMPAPIGRRVVQVFVSDPDAKVPLDKCLLYQGDIKVTDATDQELYFELDIKALLEKHNAERIKIVDKSVKDRTEYLEPAKIRDLKMSVVTITNL